MPTATRGAVQGPFWAAGHGGGNVLIYRQDRVVWIVLDAWRLAGLLILFFRRPPR